jgi:hypothetical protein
VAGAVLAGVLAGTDGGGTGAGVVLAGTDGVMDGAAELLACAGVVAGEDGSMDGDWVVADGVTTVEGVTDGAGEDGVVLLLPKLSP